MALRVLIAYTTYPGTTGFYLQRALEQVAEVRHFDLWKVPDSNVIRARLPFGYTASRAARHLRFRPDLYVEVDAAGRRHLRKPRALDCPSVLWAIDTHRPHKREYLRYVALDFDVVFVAQKDDFPLFRAPGLQVGWLPHACDPSVHRNMELARTFDIGYVGAMSPERHAKRMADLKLLARTHVVEARQGVYLEDMARLYSRSKIVFNRSIGGDLNMRVFEGMSCGAALVTDRIRNGLSDLFRDRQHLVLYDEWDMLDVIDELLADDEERGAIARAGAKEVCARHTYLHRAAQLLEAAGFPSEARALLARAAEAVA